MILKKVLVVDDEANILTAMKGVLEDEGFVVAVAKNAEEGLQKAKQFVPDVALLDIWMSEEDGVSLLGKLKKVAPGIEVIMMSGHGTVETAVKTIKMGAFDFLEKPVHFEKLLVLLNHVFEMRALRRENEYLRQELGGDGELLGESQEIQRLREAIAITAPSNGWVLLCGENGTGKELVARILHQNSLRNQKFFVAVNCAALPDDLVEIELFGCEKGAFHGASELKVGKMEQASGGTLFLDEIGDMSLKAQGKILRVLEEGVVTRVGGKDPIEIDLRVIASTHQDLRRNIREGTFREALFYRLNVIPVFVPPLRLRREDIPLLAEHFLCRYGGGKKMELSESTRQFMQTYPWPGNVRELKNWVERACILAPGLKIEATDFHAGMEEVTVLSEQERNFHLARAAFEKQFLLQMLTENGGNIGNTAQKIGVDRNQLQQKMKSYGIEVPGI